MADLTGFTPSKGQLTFANEGMEEQGSYYSRKLHVPSDTSGLTIGRGYDMKMKSKNQIMTDLVAAGVSDADATNISSAAGLAGETARKFIKDKKLESFELSPDAQLKLFNLEYSRLEADTKRLCTKPDVENKYGQCKWENIDSTIQEILVDMRYRGDYTPGLRLKIQTAIVNNKLDEVRKVLAVKSNFGNIDSNRFHARLNKIDKAIAVKKVEDKRR